MLANARFTQQKERIGTRKHSGQVRSRGDKLLPSKMNLKRKSREGSAGVYLLKRTIELESGEVVEYIYLFYPSTYSATYSACKAVRLCKVGIPNAYPLVLANKRFIIMSSFVSIGRVRV